MKALFFHPNFPGQFRHLARYLGAQANNQVVFACRFPNKEALPGVRKIVYKTSGEPKPGTHRYLTTLAADIYAGQAAWRVCRQLQEQGFQPNVIYAHPGWGDALFIKDAYPKVPLMNYMEFYYHAFGADAHFDPAEPVSPDDVARIRVRNAKHLLNLEACDWAISPTHWQKRQHPQEFREKITVLHEGIDTERIQPREAKRLTLPGGVTLDDRHEVITYVARNFEPYRGFPQVMRALEILLRERPKAHALMVGADGVSYGKRPKDGQTWRQVMLAETEIDASRIHWLGALPYKEYLTVLAHSAAHIYLTVPFVVSWSLLEAMAAGCAVVASDTEPVREVITDGANGLLVDFFDHARLAARVGEVLDSADRMQRMREAARETILDRYALSSLLPLQVALLSDLASGEVPPPAAHRIAAACNRGKPHRSGLPAR
jgi:glycosyltransferase involved in cell wall biosynthesis